MARFVAHLRGSWALLAAVFGSLLAATIGVLFIWLYSAPPGDPGRDPPATTPTTTTRTTEPDDTSEDDVGAEVAACEALVRQAQVVFETAKTMQVRRVEPVTVKASIAADAPELNGATSTTIEELPVRCFLQARLRSPKFAIDPADFQRRSFLDQSTVSWTWEVEPKEIGTLRLTLEVQSLLTPPDKPGAVEEFSTEILVEAEERSILETFNDIVVAFVTHPVAQFIGPVGLAGALSALVGALVGGIAYLFRYLFRRGRRKRQSAEPEDVPSDAR